jgi:hypothetical protein
LGLFFVTQGARSARSVAIYWLDTASIGFFAAVAAGFCLYAAMLVHAVFGMKTPNAAVAATP